MAYTKVFAITKRLDKSVAYAANEKKTNLSGMIEYAVNRSKTEQRLFETALNCQSTQTAYGEMMETKRRWNKPDGVLGYHFIQSFAPGEVTPEQAHAIGVEFARQLFGNRFEVVIGTHLDKAHPHNHIVVNSVSFADGLKYHSSPASYYNQVRGISDALCRDNALSVITPTGHGKHYAEWKAEQDGKPTIRGLIRGDIDAILADAYTFSSFLMLLEKRGYEVKHGPNRKYTAVKPPGSQRFIRLDSLGEGYTEAAIRTRLSHHRTERTSGSAPMQLHQPVKKYRLKGKLHGTPKRKITGFLALYFRYVYLLRGTRRGSSPHRAAFVLRKEVIQLRKYQEQFKYLCAHEITTAAQLDRQIKILEWDIGLLTEERKPLYLERRKTEDEAVKDRCTAEIDRHTAALRQKRRELALCRRIQSDIPKVSEAMRQEQAEREKNVKEEKQHEHQRRDR